MAAAICQASPGWFERRRPERTTVDLRSDDRQAGVSTVGRFAPGRLWQVVRTLARPGAGGRERRSGLAHLAQVRHLSGAAPELVHQHGPGIRDQSGGYRGIVFESAAERVGTMRGREAVHPGIRAGAGLAATAQWQDAEWI